MLSLPLLLSLLPKAMLSLPLLLSLLPTATAITLPPAPRLFKALDLAVYAADRQRDELLSGVKRALLGSDPLDEIPASEYALKPQISTVAVTGANDGIGREAARFLANAGFGVVLCSRDVAKGETAAAEIRSASPDARVRVVPLDLASVASVEAAAPLILSAADELGSPLRGLILNLVSGRARSRRAPTGWSS